MLLDGVDGDSAACWGLCSTQVCLPMLLQSVGRLIDVDSVGVETVSSYSRVYLYLYAGGGAVGEQLWLCRVVILWPVGGAKWGQLRVEASLAAVSGPHPSCRGESIPPIGHKAIHHLAYL